jgi:2-polyprenyl-3-methyl-5-hydroxy-6-metoxy-1,4-benzoquinol methylase
MVETLRRATAADADPPAPNSQAEPRCRLCGGAAVPAFRVTDRNRELGTESFRYLRCTQCRAICMDAVPTDLARYYETDGYGTGAQELAPEMLHREQVKLDLVTSNAPPGPVVEIGPGPGWFTRVALAQGLEMTAVEMDPNYCRQLEKMGARTVRSDDPAQALASLPPSAAVVMWHAIEHVPNPYEVLEAAVKNLTPGGVLAISSPNPESLQFRLLGRRWTHVDAPRHLQLIPHGTLQSRLAAMGMRLLSTTTTDPVGLELSRQGWEAVVRRHPARHPSTPTSRRITVALGATVGRVERSGFRGAAYTSVFGRS